MTTNEERLKILQMLQDGTITADQAASLLEALSSSKSKPIPPTPPTHYAHGSHRGGKYFRVRITDTNSGKTRVNVRLPLSLVGAGLKMGMKFSPEIEDIEPDLLQSFLESGEVGQIVDVYDDEDGEHVEVFIE